MLRCAILTLMLVTSAPGMAAPSDPAPEAGDTEAALVCAWLFTSAAERLQTNGVIDPAKRDVAYRWTERVLERYVGGSADERWAALAGFGAGRSVERVVEEFAAQGDDCLSRFPV
jgi:hypothetical protein